MSSFLKVNQIIAMLETTPKAYISAIIKYVFASICDLMHYHFIKPRNFYSVSSWDFPGFPYCYHNI